MTRILFECMARRKHYGLKVIMIATLGLTIAIPTVGQETEVEAWIPTLPGSHDGGTSCGQYIATVDGHKIGFHDGVVFKGRNFFDESMLLSQWIAGYVAGLNLIEKSTNNLQAKVQSVDIEVWLRNYCKAYPTTSVPQAVSRFYFENLR